MKILTYLIFMFSALIGVDIETFAQTSLLLLQPLEDFFNNVFVMVVSFSVTSPRVPIWG